MFYKQATVKLAGIIPIVPENKSYLIKTAGSKWISVDDFPDRYKNLFGNYITANTIRVGPYNPEFKYYRVIAVHGNVANDNADLWHWGSLENPGEPELLRVDIGTGKPVYSTFIGRGNYKNHNNDDVAKAVGIVLDVAPNHEGKFIEALLAVDTKKDPELVRGIDNSYIDSVSMGCLCGYSLCTVCGNLARNEREYCNHIKLYKGQMIQHEGQWIKPIEDNRECVFIELSWVDVPADREAVLLEKVANQTISLSENAFVMYNAIKQAMNDSKLVCNGMEDYSNLLKVINQEIQNNS